jgi:hypothetical protein
MRTHARRARAVVILVPLLVWTCGSSTAPSPAPSTGFIMVSGMNVLAAGTTTDFMANAYPAYPSLTRPVDVTLASTWSSSDPTVATVSSTGLVIARGPGSAEISATFQGTLGTVPLVVAGNGSRESLMLYVGTWSGVGALTCQRLYGLGRTLCDSPIPHPVELTLLATRGDTLTGTLQIYQSAATGAVQAALLDTDVLAVGGTVRPDDAGIIVQLREWRLSLTSDGQLTGTVFQDDAFGNVYSAQLHRERFELSGLTRK